MAQRCKSGARAEPSGPGGDGARSCGHREPVPQRPSPGWWRGTKAPGGGFGANSVENRSLRGLRGAAKPPAPSGRACRRSSRTPPARRHPRSDTALISPRSSPSPSLPKIRRIRATGSGQAPAGLSEPRWHPRGRSPAGPALPGPLLDGRPEGPRPGWGRGRRRRGGPVEPRGGPRLPSRGESPGPGG